MAIVASTQVGRAWWRERAEISVVGVSLKKHVSGMEEVAETAVVSVVAVVLNKVQLAVAPPPVYFKHEAAAAKLPGPVVILAVAVPSPSVVPTAVTVMVSV